MTRGRILSFVLVTILALDCSRAAIAQYAAAPELVNQPARLESPEVSSDAAARVEDVTIEPAASVAVEPAAFIPGDSLSSSASTLSSEAEAGAPENGASTASAIAQRVLAPDTWTSPEQLGSSVQMLLLVSVLSLAPALLVMTTSFVRSVVVLGLLRQAIGTQQLPPNQVMTALALFLTLAVMTPTWKQVYEEAIAPYSQHEIDLETAWQRGVTPVRQFMSLQIERTGNSDDVWLFLDHMPGVPTPTSYDEVPLEALVPAFMLSELKTAFLIGFQVYLPFVILDLVISSVLMSMGMLMLPPVLVSLPFKLLLFVLVDGWHLVVGMLLESFAGVV
ncbi:MAG: flagellar type III secretion system pore protein FliP [Pirellulales bacterium]|nr:flagellar type III secretion system pore protein FliP [Pirellulales bacterium]